MLRNWLKLTSVPLLAAALWVTGCTDQAQSDRLIGPESASFAKGGNATASAARAKRGAKVRGKRQSGKQASWVLIEGQLLNLRETKDEKLIGPAGGYLYTSGHYLSVPAGAVSQPTTFRIAQVKKKLGADSTTVIGVDLKASIKDAHGNVVDVGAKGFLKPLTLGLSYAWAVEQFGEDDAQQLQVVWLKSSTEVEEVVTLKVDGASKLVYGQLEHFSDYFIGFPID